MFGACGKSWIVTCAALVVLAGCASSGPGRASQAGAPGETVVIGDWNDVEAAAVVAADENETAIVTQELGEKEQVFELLTILDEPGKLVAQREGEGVDKVPIRLTCSVGLFGNPQREASILRSAAGRLEDLAGVDFRPRR